MTYARDDNGTLTYPSDTEFVGIPNWWLHDYQIRKRGYLPLAGEAEPREGFEAVPSEWHIVASEGGDYIQVTAWEYVEIPPAPEPVVKYSKYKIQLACQDRNLWERVKEAIASAGLTDSWSNIVELSSDNQELKDALPEIKKMFGADVVDAVLRESIV